MGVTRRGFFGLLPALGASSLPLAPRRDPYVRLTAGDILMDGFDWRQDATGDFLDLSILPDKAVLDRVEGLSPGHLVSVDLSGAQSSVILQRAMGEVLVVHRYERCDTPHMNISLRLTSRQP